MDDKFYLTKEQNLFLAKKVLVSNIYNSTRLEKINTTYPDTKTILEGVNVPNLKLDEVVDLDFICKINYLISRNESLE